MKDVMRLRYFDNEFLDAVDFGVEQEYHRSMRYHHTRYFHTWGLSHNGLEVSIAEGQEPGEETKVVVSPGIALDNEGREIVLAESRIVDFDQPQYKGGKSYYITIYWYEQQGLPRQDNEHKRWVEVPEIETTEEFPKHPDMTLVLALVKLREDKTVETIDGSMRRYAAHEVGNKTVSSVKIIEADGTSGQNINRGDGIKTGHIQDEAVTLAKLSEDARRFIIPVGCVAAFAMTTPPDGWLECNGQQISRTHYARLFSRIGLTFGSGNGSTTFNVPDLRGVFSRGWDHGRNMDPGRGFGSFQWDQMQSHKHHDPGHWHWRNSDYANELAWRNIYPYGQHGVPGGPFDKLYQISKVQTSYTNIGDPVRSSNGDPRHGSETRPRNVALMYCIKY